MGELDSYPLSPFSLTNSLFEYLLLWYYLPLTDLCTIVLGILFFHPVSHICLYHNKYHVFLIFLKPYSEWKQDISLHCSLGHFYIHYKRINGGILIFIIGGIFTFSIGGQTGVSVSRVIRPGSPAQHSMIIELYYAGYCASITWCNGWMKWVVVTGGRYWVLNPLANIIFLLCLSPPFELFCTWTIILLLFALF